MKNQKIRNSLLLVLTALIWGSALVAQSKGGNAVGAFTFNGLRSLIGSAALLPVIMILDKVKPSAKKPETPADKRLLWLGGGACGVIMFLASSAQQLGLCMGTAAGKAGFLTACYILIVPLLGLFLKKKCGWNIWLGMGITLVGLYLLCMTDSFRFQTGDLLILLCAVLFAIHILVIDYFSPRVDGVRMSCIQFLICGLLSMIPMFFAEMQHSVSGMKIWMQNLFNIDVWIPLLYAGVLSCGVGYTLQIVGQDGLNPTVASMLMSLESVFSVLAGWLILKEMLGTRQIIGCVLIFAAILLAQLPVEKLQGGWKKKAYAGICERMDKDVNDKLSNKR